MKSFLSIVLGLSIFATILVGCNAGTTLKSEVYSYSDFVEALKIKGHQVNEVTREEQDTIIFDRLFSVDVQFIDIEGQIVYVYEFTDIETAKNEAETIGPSGSTGNVCISWVKKPYFYQKNTLIVLHTIGNEGILADFEDILGKPFR